MAPLVWLMLLGYSTLVSSHDISSSQGKNIFILSGQSNMAGRGGRTKMGWDGILPFECKPNPNILRFNSSFQWEEAHEPLHIDIDILKLNGIGPGMPFANRVLEKNPSFGVIGLVPCATGGTSLAQWAKGTPLYEMMMMRAQASLRDGGVIRALLWYQGESDINNGTTYGAKFQQLITDVRSNLQLPNLPVIQVALDEPVGEPDNDVRKVQLTFNFPNVKTVDAKGQPLQGDYVHLTTEAEIHVGQMFADTFLQYFKTAPTAST